VPGHRYCDGEHTRRGAWQGAFCALGVVHGFENSWGPFMMLEEDQPGLAYLLHLRRFFTDVVPSHRMQPAPETIVASESETGHRPLALATPEYDVVAVYLPTGGEVTLSLPEARPYDAQRFDPRTGELHLVQRVAQQLRPATLSGKGEQLSFAAPAGHDKNGHPWDWVLVLSR
jgi:hypothetical protein